MDLMRIFKYIIFSIGTRCFCLRSGKAVARVELKMVGWF